MSTPAVARSAPPNPFAARFTTPLLLGSTLNPINTSMIATGLVAIGVGFQAEPGTTASLVSILYVCSAIAQPTMGKLAGLFGPRRIFLSGLVILVVAGIVGAAAPAFGFLLLSRALIGIGTAAAYPSAMAMVRQRADAAGMSVPGRILGSFSIAAQVTVVIGLPLGGILVGAFGWRSLFLVNVPLAVIAIIAVLIGVPRDQLRPHSDRTGRLAALDLSGIVLFAGTITSLLLFLQGLDSPSWWLVPLIAVLGTALFVHESRASEPLIDVRMLGANRPLQRTYLRQLLVGLGMYAVLYGAPQWMEQSVGLDASAVGFILLPLSALSIVVARIASRRNWVRWPLILAGASQMLTATVMLLISSGSGIPLLILMTVMVGLTNGLSGFANQAALLVQVPAGATGVASGLYRTFGYIGAILSASLISLTFGSAATDAGFHVLALALLGIGLVLVLVTALDRDLLSVIGQ